MTLWFPTCYFRKILYFKNIVFKINKVKIQSYRYVQANSCRKYGRIQWNRLALEADSFNNINNINVSL